MERDGMLLLSWLRLLGWVVVVEETDGRWSALARRESAAGGVLEVEASARDHADLAWILFSGALSRLERERTSRAA